MNTLRVFFLESSIAESCYAISGETRSSFQINKHRITFCWPRLLPYPYFNVSVTELHAIKFIPRYFQLLFRAFEAVFIVYSCLNNRILRQHSNAWKWLDLISKRLFSLNLYHGGRLSQLWSIFRRSMSVFVLNLCWEEIMRDLVISHLYSGKNRWSL